MLDFQFSGAWITSLSHVKGLFKIIFEHNYFTTEPIFKNFAAHFRTFGLQNDDIVIFFLYCFTKVRF